MSFLSSLFVWIFIDTNTFIDLEMYNRNQNSFKNYFWNEQKHWPHKQKQLSNQTQMVSIRCACECVFAGNHTRNHQRHFSSSSFPTSHSFFWSLLLLLFFLIANDTNIYFQKKLTRGGVGRGRNDNNNNKIDSKQNEAHSFDAVIYSISVLNLLFIIVSVYLDYMHLHLHISVIYNI